MAATDDDTGFSIDGTVMSFDTHLMLVTYTYVNGSTSVGPMFATRPLRTPSSGFGGNPATSQQFELETQR